MANIQLHLRHLRPTSVFTLEEMTEEFLLQRQSVT